MIKTAHTPYLKGAVQALGLIELTLALQHDGKVVHALERVRLLRTQLRLLTPERPAEQISADFR